MSNGNLKPELAELAIQINFPPIVPNHEFFYIWCYREPGCRLRSLNVSKCLLGGLDAACLGETVRRARQLDALRCSGASRPADVMPLVMGLAEGGSQLQLLDLSSPRLALDDHPCRLLCHALARNASLRLLNLDGWTFRIEESETLLAFAELLNCTGVRELSLCNARLHLAIHEGPLSRLGRRDDAGAELMKAASPPNCTSVVFLRLAGFQVTVNDRLALRGPQLLPFLSGFTNLLELDLSLDKSAALGGLDSGTAEPRSSSPGSPTRSTLQHQQLHGSTDTTVDERQLVQFFTELGSHFRQLQSLRANFWRCSLDECSERVGRQVAKLVRPCKALSVLRLGSLVVVDRSASSGNKGGPPQQQRVEHVLLQALLTGLDSLAWLSLDGVELSESQADSLGKYLRERFRGSSLEISARDVRVEALKTLVVSTERGGRAEVSWAGGPPGCCRLRIERLQNKTRTKPKSK
ncbi:hypothetical protein QAD02_004225 [Eretmocerus hayati]|uniref:Uncharacterized protein n=1 Tax=Eretmocerus hayati TaxID=131215 RepID=A0ACC2NRM9_9HYME|nr:hypothetical protein QAD02_004225 [Eretmocerus hayati]